MADIYRQIVKVRDEGRRAVLATIVRRLGSAPRKDAAKMLIRDDGSSAGTVGGGRVEAEVCRKARAVMESGRSELLKYELTDEDAESEGLICGGAVEIFIEPILPDPQVVIFGAGHLGLAIAESAHRVGFEITICDDRETFANRERFPMADNVVVSPFESSLAGTRINNNTYILIVTRGHRYDRIVLEQAIQTEARYVGMVGSRRKIQIVVQNLLQKGYAPDLFDKLYAPIGIDIGSETPEEIAVAVVAELIALRRGAHRRSDKQLFVRKFLKES